MLGGEGAGAGEDPSWVVKGEIVSSAVRLASTESRTRSVSLGADPYLPGRYIVSFLRVFKQFACNIPRG